MLKKISISLAALAAALIVLASPAQAGQPDAGTALDQAQPMSNDGGGGGP
jgi:hypothetical protein